MVELKSKITKRKKWAQAIFMAIYTHEYCLKFIDTFHLTLPCLQVHFIEHYIILQEQ